MFVTLYFPNGIINYYHKLNDKNSTRLSLVKKNKRTNGHLVIWLNTK